MTRDQCFEATDEELLRCCRQENFRASGPGGQHRNVTDSAVRLTLPELGVSASAADHRSQHRNRAEALKRLRLQLALQVRCEPSAGPWQGAWKIGRKDRRYPRFIAVVLDALAANGWAVGDAARQLGTSTGRLVRTLAQDPQVWDCVNHARQKLNLVNLRKP